MGADSKIEWTHHTFNPWWGCQRVSPGCQHCYAETFDKRIGGKHWGPTAPRRTFGEKHWNEPRKWARAAAKAGERRRVFCASMADVFEDRPELEQERRKLWALIRETARLCSAPAGECRDGYDGSDGDCPHCGRSAGGLDWLLLTKRPENVLRIAPADILPLVWVGTTVEDQQRADERIPALLRVPAGVRFLSMEPLLEPVDLRMGGASIPDYAPHRPVTIDWIIVGGESGHGARPFDLAWARSIHKQCRTAGVACFVKQLGKVPMISTAEWAAGQGLMQVNPENRPRVPEGKTALWFSDSKAGNPSEWPADLRVREFPEVRS